MSKPENTKQKKLMPLHQENEKKQLEMFKDLCLHATEVNTHRTKDLLGQDMATKIHAANLDIRSRLPQLHTYNIHQLAAISLQIERIGEYYRKKEDHEFENCFDALFILAQSIPALGLISRAIPPMNIVFIPIVVLMYSLLYLHNNSKRPGLEKKGSNMLKASIGLSTLLIIIASLSFIGLTLPFTPLILPVAAILNIGLFLFATYREYKRDNEGSILLNDEINDAFKNYLKQRDQEELYQAILQQDNNNQIKQLDDESQKALMQSYIIRAHICTLLREYSNTTRTIKSPFSKKTHIQNIRQLQENLSQHIINSSLNEYTLPEHLNWKTFIRKGKDTEVEQALIRQHIDPERLRKKISEDPIYEALQYTKHDMQKYYHRDIPYLACNSIFIILAVCIMLPFIPLALASGTMIAIAAIVGLYALVNISQRLYTRCMPKNEQYTHALDNMRQLRFTFCKKDLTTANKKIQRELSPELERLAIYKTHVPTTPKQDRRKGPDQPPQ